MECWNKIEGLNLYRLNLRLSLRLAKTKEDDEAIVQKARTVGLQVNTIKTEVLKINPKTLTKFK